ncbi:hypothetical protein HDK90DRAFT_226198 [Phyllosticta capitalensis]|uniref:Uncharacterized protein n=1 Tax=Phyllosticta capitalensis TaxID=121624 RepID=A0ABR1YTZ9_9PEZI
MHAKPHQIPRITIIPRYTLDASSSLACSMALQPPQSSFTPQHPHHIHICTSPTMQTLPRLHPSNMPVSTRNRVACTSPTPKIKKKKALHQTVPDRLTLLTRPLHQQNLFDLYPRTHRTLSSPSNPALPCPALPCRHGYPKQPQQLLLAGLPTGRPGHGQRNAADGHRDQDRSLCRPVALPCCCQGTYAIIAVAVAVAGPPTNHRTIATFLELRIIHHSLCLLAFFCFALSIIYPPTGPNAPLTTL